MERAPNASRQDDPPSGLFAAGGKPGAGSAILQNVRITADVTNNAVLGYANQESSGSSSGASASSTGRSAGRDRSDHAEVTLNDQLNYGLRLPEQPEGSIAGAVASPAAGSSSPADQTESSSTALLSAGNLLGQRCPAPIS